MSSASVSVVIPLYNGRRFLAQAIESVLGQSVAPLELIVVDDGSSDDGLSVAARYPEVRCYCTPHGGQGAALNRGVEVSRGNLLAFLDQDDLWVPDKLKLQLLTLDDLELEAVAGHAAEFMEGRDGNERILPARLVSALLLRREAWTRVGRFRAELGMGMQLEWFGRAAALGLKLHMLNDVVYRRRIHGDNYGLRQREDRLDYVRAIRELRSTKRLGPHR